MVGKWRTQIESILGQNHFTTNYENTNTLWYFYSNDNPFEGCDKIFITFENEISIDAGIGGCD